MKIKPEHLKIMQDKILKLIDSDWREWINRYETGNFPRAEKVKDLQKRFCFDIWYAADFCPFECSNLYSYLTDVHIYTALKSLCPRVTRKY